MAEKTEKATPKKLKDARKKGQVAKSQDFPSAITFVVSMVATLGMAGYLFEQIGGFMLQCFRSVGPNMDFENRASGFLQLAIQTIMRTSLPIMVAVSLIGVLVNFLVIGPVFSLETMKFEFKKLNPIEGIKQKFKMKTLVELLKSNSGNQLHQIGETFRK